MAESKTSRERFPELYVPSSELVDPRTRTRTVPMRVICVGMPRTGTASLRTALDQLGYDKCYHMLSTISNPLDVDMWLEAANDEHYGLGKPFGREQWDQLLGDCQSLCDLPSMAFAASLIESYPDAKVILTLRDVDAWHKSMMDTIIPANRSPALKIMSLLDPDRLGRWSTLISTLVRVLFADEPFEEVGKQKFIEHYDKMRALVPKEKLLEYKVGEGWERLCDFLGEPVPEGQFPRTNETKSFGDRRSTILRLAMLRALKRALPIAGAVGAAGAALYFYST